MTLNMRTYTPHHYHNKVINGLQLSDVGAGELDLCVRRQVEGVGEHSGDQVPAGPYAGGRNGKATQSIGGATREPSRQPPSLPTFVSCDVTSFLPHCGQAVEDVGQPKVWSVVL